MSSVSARIRKLHRDPEQFLRDARSPVLRVVGSALTRAVRGRAWTPDWDHELAELVASTPLADAYLSRAWRRRRQRRRLVTDHGEPKVSVVMAAQNASATIESAIGSLLSQSYRQLEVVVVDDASDDATASVVAQIDDERLRVVRRARAGGAGRARNDGLAAATGRFITFQDADDTAHPERLERQLAGLLGNPGARVCVSNGRRVDEAGRPVRVNGRVDRKAVISMMFSRETFDALGYFMPLVVGEDSEYLERIKTVYGRHTELRLYTPLYFAGFHPDSLLFSHGDTVVAPGGDVRHERSAEAERCRREAREFHARIIRGDVSPYVDRGPTQSRGSSSPGARI
ncbi:MAG: glycosyltransferase family A protein [Myxococcota bacterium]